MLGSNQRPLPCEGSEAVSYASKRLGKSAYVPGRFSRRRTVCATPPPIPRQSSGSQVPREPPRSGRPRLGTRRTHILLVLGRRDTAAVLGVALDTIGALCGEERLANRRGRPYAVDDHDTHRLQRAASTISTSSPVSGSTAK